MERAYHEVFVLQGERILDAIQVYQPLDIKRSALVKRPTSRNFSLM